MLVGQGVVRVEGKVPRKARIAWVQAGAWSGPAVSWNQASPRPYQASASLRVPGDKLLVESARLGVLALMKAR